MEGKKVVPIANVVGKEMAEAIKIANHIVKAVEGEIGMPMNDFISYVGDSTGKAVSEQTKTAGSFEKEKDEVYTKIAAAYDKESAEYVHSSMMKVAELLDVSGEKTLDDLKAKITKLASDLKADTEMSEKTARAILGDLGEVGKDISELTAETSSITGIPMDFSKTAAEKSDLDKVAELLAVSGQPDVFALRNEIKKHIGDVVEKKAALATAGYDAATIEKMSKYLI